VPRGALMSFARRQEAVMDDDVRQCWLTVQDLYTKKVSYAQNHEDILLDRAFGRPSGFYVDIGANDPVFHSVTKYFYDMGWRGINVEPNPSLHRRLGAHRPRDLNLNAGISNLVGSLTFYEIPAVHGWSTFEPEFAAHYRKHGAAILERPIPVMTLRDLFEKHVTETVDFLKIDVEGFERQVVEGADWSRWRPRVVVIEATWPQVFEPALLGAGYHLAANDGINRYYVRDEDRPMIERLATPVNVLDNYVPYEYVRLFESSGVAPDLSPASIAFVRKLKALTRRHPRMASFVKRALRLAG
jgi:FkbM family methyltransferase